MDDEAVWDSSSLVRSPVEEFVTRVVRPLVSIFSYKAENSDILCGQ